MTQEMTIEEFEQLMVNKQKDMNEQEVSNYVGIFWNYFHLAYC